MPQPTFRGDPYRVLDIKREASAAVIKRRWRELAREHHPDRAAGDSRRTAQQTRRMARINAAYDLLRDPDRRARYDAGQAGAGRTTSSDGDRPGGRRPFEARSGSTAQSGPPRPRPTRPVTGRFDTTELFHGRNVTTSKGRPPLAGQRPVSARERGGEAEPLRASDPNGPVERRASRGRVALPTLEEARGRDLVFGKFRGHTLGEVERFEPTYIDWIARTITRDRDLVICARVIQADLDERGVERRVRPATPGFGTAGNGAKPRG
jgi:curved DNA-binding protein CbpA